MSETQNQIIIQLVKITEEHERQIGELLEMLQSLQRNLTNAFKEAGYDFAKIARMESSRRANTIAEDTNVEMLPEELDPAIQDRLAKEILAGESLPPLTNAEIAGDPRAEMIKAANKGRKE